MTVTHTPTWSHPIHFGNFFKTCQVINIYLDGGIKYSLERNIFLSQLFNNFF